MTSSDVWDAESAERYDETSAEKFAPEVLDPAVDFLARLAGSGPALELAVGTGRVAVPLLAAAGHDREGEEGRGGRLHRSAPSERARATTRRPIRSPMRRPSVPSSG